MNHDQLLDMKDVSSHDTPPKDIFWKAKFKAAAWHFLICVTVACTIFLLISRWYPDGLLTLAGGLTFFITLVCCDVVLGPVITLIVYSIKKSKKERFWDFAIIGVVQIVALSIGLQAIIDGRPVFAAFSGSKIEVINAVNMQAQELAAASDAKFQTLSWQGPIQVVVAQPQTPEEQNLAMDSLLEGYGPSYMPRFYQHLDGSALSGLQNALKPIAQLKQIAPERADELSKKLQQYNLNEDNAGWLDVETSRGFGVAILDKQSGNIQFYLDIDA